MKSFKRLMGNWKVPMILLVAIALGIFTLPTEYQPSFVPDSIKEMKINLGLDLQGGSQLDYKIDLSNVDEADEDQIVNGILEVINERVNRLGVSEPNIYLSNVGSERHVIVELAGVKDLDEAKSQVGKTIQLEFKTESEATENENLDVVRENAETFKLELQSGEFSEIAQLEAKADPDKVIYDSFDTPLYEDQITGDNVIEALKELEVGEFTFDYFEDTLGLSIVEERIVQKEGLTFVKLNSKEELEREKVTPREVTLRTLLIPFEGATESSSTLSRDEAIQRGAEIIGEITTNESSLESYSSEFALNSDLLGDAIELEQIKPSLETVDELYEVSVETEYGIVLVEAESIEEEKEETVNEVAYTFETLVFSTLPDPWESTGLNGSMFERADVVFNDSLAPIVSISFNAEGGKMFSDITEANIGKRLAIFVGGKLVSSPNLSQKISGGEAIITGNFDLAEAQELARDLNTGAIPAPIVLVGQYTIGASLGQAALMSSLKAGALGLVLLGLYMIAYYRFAGVLANIALFIYSILLVFVIKVTLPMWLALIVGFVIYCVTLGKIYASEEKMVEKTLSFVVSTFALFFISFLLSAPVVLTLAGVAGIVLSIGMAVDANVLIFERIKEEIRAGRNYKKAVEEGFDKAWSSIRDSNFSSLITCGILYSFGSSIIRGFALNLAAGILISMFTAITVTRGMLVLAGKIENKNLKLLFGTDKKDKEREPIDFISKSKIWFTISATIVVISICSIAIKGLNTGIDFTGGTLMDVAVVENSDFTKEQVLAVVTEAVGSEDVTVIDSGENTFQIKTKFIQEGTHDVILQNLRNESGSEIVENRFTTVGPTISDSLKTKAVSALVIALFAVIIYIALTFRNIPKGYSPWKFGLSAMVALTHDVIITLGIFSLFGLQVDALFITALLTVIGFSVHDTIVVFDRVRENLKGSVVSKGNFGKICNISLTQTLARSINTSISTLLTLLALLILGSPSIFEFILALVIGIGIGTYSSIFIASPTLNKFQDR